MSQCLTCNSIRAGTVDDNFTFLDNSGNSNPITQPSTHPPTPANMSTHLGSAHIDPAEDDTPASNLHKAEATTFAEAIGKVLKSNNSSKPKLQEPDPFDGYDSHKLRTLSLSANLTSKIARIYLRMILIRSIISS